MSRLEKVEHPAARRREVGEAVKKLRAALDKVGVVLPSLDTDPVGVSYNPAIYLVELGRVNVETACKLTAVLEQVGREETGE
ncbi:hypothetical protein [Streptomyces sp. TS71-3]|uniref:hypothetical protein n=1 Tax=Streptomyces sp. TS71-3 TaxID=2733862 RepID=UPI001B156B6F|nr:hypothetical protein [Streptomyces sp. TS71-3]GHJ36712.1 hypothetical protein Sm713_23210 [Streptomyces sp. TS71-3]